MRPLLFASALFLALAAFFAWLAWDIAPEWLVSAIFLLLLAGTAVITARLLLLRPEAVAVAAGLAAVFLTGFLGALARGDRDWQGWSWEVGVLGLVLTIGTIPLIGWFASVRWAAALACAAFIPLAWIAAVLGAYAAYATGWQGLDINTFGSDDQPGLSNAAWTFALATPFWSTYAVIAAVVGWFVNTIRPRGGEPGDGSSPLITPPTSAPAGPQQSDERHRKRRRTARRPANRRFAG